MDVDLSTEVPVPLRRRRFQGHLVVDDRRLGRVFTEIMGHGLSRREVRRLQWFRFKCGVHTAGFLAGLLALLAVCIGFPVVFLLAGLRVPLSASSLSAVVASLVWVVGAGFAAWHYLYLSVSTFDTAAPFARSALETVRRYPLSASIAPGSTGLSLANASGNTARALFRAYTGRRLNVANRPDVSQAATSLAEKIMLRVPTSPSELEHEFVPAGVEYANLLHDLTGIIAIGRVDLAEEVIARSGLRNAGPSVLISPGSAEVRQFLHPLGRKSVLDAIAVYLLPAFAVVISLIALVKP